MAPSKFFRFREERYWNGSQPVVGFAADETVKSLCSTEEMTAIFGGYLVYENVDGSQKYLGVWGDRKVGRLLRLLRERGAALETDHPSPSRFRQRYRASRGVRRIVVAQDNSPRIR
jgi:hypothetical protein